jgi:hypothetical protein
MIIDFLNSEQLIKGETYLITLPEMELDCATIIRSQLEQVSDDCGVKFIVLIGEVNIQLHNKMVH